MWEHMLRETSIGAAPWYVVEGADANYRNLTVGKILLEAMVQDQRRREARAARRRSAPRAVGHRQRRADPPTST